MSERDRWRSAVIGDVALSGTDVLVAVVIDESDGAPIGQEELARHCRLGLRTLQRSIKALTEHGHLVMTAGHGRATSSYSRGTLIGRLKDSQPITASTRVKKSPPVLVLTSTDPPPPRSPSGIRAAFEAFFAAFPREDDPRLAAIKFAQAVKRGVDPAVMIDGAKRYAIERARAVAHEPGDEQFTRKAHTWIEAAAWLNPPAAPPIDSRSTLARAGYRNADDLAAALLGGRP
jgi:hypothetical protein